MCRARFSSRSHSTATHLEHAEFHDTPLNCDVIFVPPCARCLAAVGSRVCVGGKLSRSLRPDLTIVAS
eukprot:289099-Chlamydomonas_euryale.AAC.1